MSDTLTAPTWLEAALSYARRGWHVFPCRPRGKEPLTPHGCKDASCDPNQIRAWWGRWPSANIGIACGPSHLGVVDLDGQEGLDSWATLGLGGETPTAQTAKGAHLYFNGNGHDLRPAVGLLPGLDIRAGTSYVIAPPSVHPSGAVYQWADFLSPDDVPLADFPEPLAARLGGGGLRIAQTPGPAATLPERIGEGQRNALLTSLAGSMRRRGATEGAILAALLEENAQRCDPPLDDVEVRQIAASVARYEPAEPPDADPLADQKDYGHALVLGRLFQGRYRWATHRGCWMRWTGQGWRPADDATVAKDAADTLRGEYARQLAAATDKDVVRRLATKAAETCVFARIGGALAFLRGWPGILTPPEAWDADPWLLNVANGTVDLRTGELRPHNPADLLTKLAPVDFDPHADGSKWQAHLERFLPNPNIRRQVQRDLGLALVGATLEEALPIWHGTGANGKTTTARVLQRVLGDYAKQAAPDLLLQARYDRHPTELADLCGSRLVFSIEPDAGRKLAESLVKSLTGGDTQKARYMRQDFFEFEQTFSIILVANHRPVVTGADDGIWRRIRLVPWEYRIPDCEKRPQEEVVNELAGPAVLNWLLEGLKDWQGDHHWTAPEVRAATEAYRTEQDALGGFLAECCEFGPRYAVGVGELYEAYTKWTTEAGEEAIGKTKFGELLRQRGVGQKRKPHTRERLWMGVRLVRNGNQNTVEGGGQMGTTFPYSSTRSANPNDYTESLSPFVPMNANPQGMTKCDNLSSYSQGLGVSRGQYGNLVTLCHREKQADDSDTVTKCDNLSSYSLGIDARVGIYGNLYGNLVTLCHREKQVDDSDTLPVCAVCGGELWCYDPDGRPLCVTHARAVGIRG